MGPRRVKMRSLIRAERFSLMDLRAAGAMTVGPKPLDQGFLSTLIHQVLYQWRLSLRLQASMLFAPRYELPFDLVISDGLSSVGIVETSLNHAGIRQLAKDLVVTTVIGLTSNDVSHRVFCGRYGFLGWSRSPNGRFCRRRTWRRKRLVNNRLIVAKEVT